MGRTSTFNLILLICITVGAQKHYYGNTQWTVDFSFSDGNFTEKKTLLVDSSISVSYLYRLGANNSGEGLNPAPYTKIRDWNVSFLMSHDNLHNVDHVEMTSEMFSLAHVRSSNGDRYASLSLATPLPGSPDPRRGPSGSINAGRLALRGEHYSTLANIAGFPLCGASGCKLIRNGAVCQSIVSHGMTFTNKIVKNLTTMPADINHDSRWVFPADNYTIGLRGRRYPFLFEIATAASDIIVPPVVFADVQYVLHAVRRPDGEYVVDCRQRDIAPPLKITLKGVVAEVHPSTYIEMKLTTADTCRLMIRPSRDTSVWILGTAFLESVGVCLDTYPRTGRFFVADVFKGDLNLPPTPNTYYNSKFIPLH